MKENAAGRFSFGFHVVHAPNTAYRKKYFDHPLAQNWQFKRCVAIGHLRKKRSPLRCAGQQRGKTITTFGPCQKARRFNSQTKVFKSKHGSPRWRQKAQLPTKGTVKPVREPKQNCRANSARPLQSIGKKPQQQPVFIKSVSASCVRIFLFLLTRAFRQKLNALKCAH